MQRSSSPLLRQKSCGQQRKKSTFLAKFSTRFSGFGCFSQDPKSKKVRFLSKNGQKVHFFCDFFVTNSAIISAKKEAFGGFGVPNYFFGVPIATFGVPNL